MYQREQKRKLLEEVWEDLEDDGFTSLELLRELEDAGIDVETLG